MTDVATAAASATLLAVAARIDVAGQPLLPKLDVKSNAARLGLVGEWSPLFNLLTGEAELASGLLTMAGVALPLAVQRGRVGVVRLDPALPAAWTSEQLLTSSAELAGSSRTAAERVSFQTLDKLGLLGLSGKRLGHLAVVERRALLVAHAIITDPTVLCIERPFAGLDTAAEQLLLAVIERAAKGRRLVVALGDPVVQSAERELALRSDELLRLSAGVVLSESPEPAVKTRCTATVCRNHHAFAAALAERGLSAHPTHEAGILSTLTSTRSGPAWRYLVELSGGSTAPILDAALETDAGLVELLPA